MENWNKKLKELYQLPKEREREIDELCEDITWPLLLKINEELYTTADLKIMVLGKETNGWMPKKQYSENGIENLMEFYYDFTGSGKVMDVKYGYQFWGYIKKLYKELSKKKNIYIIWNNVLKIGIDGRGTPPSEIIEAGKRNYKIKEEISILKPDLVLFLSGHNYDKYISPDIQIEEKMVEDKLVKLKIPGFPVSYRTEHPVTMNFRWYAKEYELVFNKIIECCNHN